MSGGDRRGGGPRDRGPRRDGPRGRGRPGRSEDERPGRADRPRITGAAKPPSPRDKDGQRAKGAPRGQDGGEGGPRRERRAPHEREAKGKGPRGGFRAKEGGAEDGRRKEGRVGGPRGEERSASGPRAANDPGPKRTGDRAGHEPNWRRGLESGHSTGAVRRSGVRAWRKEEPEHVRRREEAKSRARDPANDAPDELDAAPNARKIAVDVLSQVLVDDGAGLDRAFAGHRRLGGLSPRDRSFARMLAATVVRRQGQIDALIRPLLRFMPHDPKVMNMLRIGVAQLHFLATPAHAAVAETVALARGPAAKDAGLINAVLRKIAAEGLDVLRKQDEIEINLPKWLMERWTAQFGAEEARAIGKAALEEPPLDISVKDERDLERWAAALGGEPLFGVIRKTGGGRIEAMAGFEEGAWWVQDLAATLPVRALGEVAGKRILDLGAAPGGKTCQLAARGARVTAIERAPKRMAALEENLARVGFAGAVETVAADAHDWTPASPFDAVLLDAPCTATGTLRRNPDAMRSKSPSDVERLAVSQAKLIDRAVEFARPGGAIVYAVCSLLDEEGPSQIRAALERHAGVLELAPLRASDFGGAPVRVDDQGCARTSPADLENEGRLDGFFIARLVKRDF